MTSKLQRLTETELRYDGPMPQEARDYIEHGADEIRASDDDLRIYLSRCVESARANHRYSLKAKDPHWRERYRDEAWTSIFMGRQHRAKLSEREHAGAAHIGRTA